MRYFTLLWVFTILCNSSLACDCESQAVIDFDSLQAAVHQVSNATINQSRKQKRAGSRALNSTHPGKLSRRGCAPYLDPETQMFDGTYVCDKEWPSLQMIQDMLRNTGLVTNSELLPAYYTGWTNDQMADPLWKACILNWLWKYTGKTPLNPNGNLGPGFYWYWNALPQGWFQAQLAQIEKFMYNPNNSDDDEDAVFPEGADVVFQNCVSEAFAKECVHDTVILFAPKDYVLGSAGQRQI